MKRGCRVREITSLVNSHESVILEITASPRRLFSNRGATYSTGGENGTGANGTTRKSVTGGGIFAGIMSAGMANRSLKFGGDSNTSKALNQALKYRQRGETSDNNNNSRRSNVNQNGVNSGSGSRINNGGNSGSRRAGSTGTTGAESRRNQGQTSNVGVNNRRNVNRQNTVSTKSTQQDTTASAPTASRNKNNNTNGRMNQPNNSNDSNRSNNINTESSAATGITDGQNRRNEISSEASRSQSNQNNRVNKRTDDFLVINTTTNEVNNRIKKVKEVTFKKPVIALPKFVTITNLADILKVRFTDLQSRMKSLGFEDVNHDFIIDEETAHLIADELGYEVVINESQGTDLFAAPMPEDSSSIPLRPPIVTIMGHVDHGKTTVLDYLRKSSIAAQEHGGITQHIGAFSVKMANTKREICFLDTPGHAAFLNMRQRGANLTDIVILIVAADDSVMPQTKEAIKHAKAANVPMIVAINKIDRLDADPSKVLSDLANNGVEIEEYGGDTQTVQVSGKTGQGIEKLEEAILTLSEVLDMRAPITGNVEGWVIESQMKKGLGSVATVLVRRGTLKAGDIIVAGTKWCKVRMLKDDQGKIVKSAGPGKPVEVLGWKELPEAGDEVLQAESESLAKQVVDNRQTRFLQIKEAQDISAINEKRRQMHLVQEQEQERQERVRLGLPVTNEDEAGNTNGNGDSNGSLGESGDNGSKINYIVKADVSGSAEAVRDSIQGLGNDDIQASVLYSGVGDVTDSDVSRAQTSNSVILTFNVKTPREVSAAASMAKVEIISHTIIYRLLEDVSNMLSSKLKPDIKQKVLGEASVREVFSITTKKSKPLLIAGCKVTNGLLSRKAKVKVVRGNKVVYTGAFTSMKHHKDEVNETKKDSECGISLEDWDKFLPGDSIQTYEEIIIPRHL